MSSRGRSRAGVHLPRSCGYLSITCPSRHPPTHTRSPTALNPQPPTAVPTHKCIFLKRSPHYISSRPSLLLHRISGRLCFVGGERRLWARGGGCGLGGGGSVVGEPFWHCNFLTAGTNHYHFPDHALCGNSPPYCLNLSHCCQSQRTN